jgi:hypothetical protein
VGYGHVPLFTATQEFCDVLREFVRTGNVPMYSSARVPALSSKTMI